MRWYALPIVLLCGLAHAQDSPSLTVTANACIADIGESLVPTGTFSIQATDGNDSPIPVGGAGYQATAEPSTRPITNGSIVGALTIPNPAFSSPQPLFRITIYNKSTQKYTYYRKAGIVVSSGSTWNFCNFQTGTVTPSIPLNVLRGLTGANGAPGVGFNGVVYTQGLATLEQAVSACPSSGACQVVVTTAIALSDASYQIPSGVSVLWLRGGVLTLSGAQHLDASLSPFINGPRAQIFTGTGTVTGLAYAMPEWWGYTPAQAAPVIANAVKALASGGGVVDLTTQSYRSGYDDLDGVAMVRDNITIRGVGPGIPDESLHHCLGGTRIIGKLAISGSNNFHLSGFCVDAGTDVIASYYTAQSDALGIYSTVSGQNASAPETIGGTVEDVAAVVSSAAAPNHAILIENVNGLRASHLTGYGGTHGIVFKDAFGSAQGLISRHHATDGVYVKSDLYAIARDFHVSDVIADDSQSGVIVQAAGADTQGISVTGVSCSETVGITPSVPNSACIDISAYGQRLVTGVTISNVSGRTGKGVYVEPSVGEVSLSNLAFESPSIALDLHGMNTVVQGLTVHGPALSSPISIGSDAGITSISNVIIGSGFGSAINNAGSLTQLSNVSIGAWGGACVNNAGGMVSARNLTGTCGVGLFNGANISRDGSVTGVITTTANTTDSLALPGVSSSSSCIASPANSTAAADTANDFIGQITANSITLVHAATAGMVYRIQCQF